MAITPHNWISTKHQKHRCCAPGFFRTIINKQEGVTLYQTICDSRLFIPRTFGAICKQPGPKIITTVMRLWILIAQYTPHGISNSKQISNETDHYR